MTINIYLQGGREGGREGGSEEWGNRERWNEVGRDGGIHGRREGGRERERKKRFGGMGRRKDRRKEKHGEGILKVFLIEPGICCGACQMLP